ncbi:protein phosphatase CheZ [Fundidesulfovibrio terrae]|uniref:protein phosphatase CheZ n=1 Tax=Fundidesulfovibrio terrae TaxID=2922866 RepID=UPI001FB0481D|nr:protein phosphatase CheZ [Fundidesulfovibrio terrae]
MTGPDTMIDGLMDKYMDDMVDSLKSAITQAVEKELSRSLTRSLLQSEFYKRISDDMRNGLQSIYKELSNARQEESGTGIVKEKKRADQLFSEAADQLDKILSTTEQATGEIMDIVEKHMDMQSKSNQILHSLKSGGVTKEQLGDLREMSDSLNADLMTIMTTLSFQDLTGQRIKRIIGAIKNVEAIVLDLYLSTGLKVKAHEEAPDMDLDQIEAEADKKVNELKGPQVGTSQASVDDLLASLGM